MESYAINAFGKYSGMLLTQLMLKQSHSKSFSWERIVSVFKITKGWVLKLTITEGDPPFNATIVY